MSDEDSRDRTPYPTDAVLEHAFNVFITPIVWARSLNGEDLNIESVRSFFVFADHPDGPLVEINDEGLAWTRAKATRNLLPDETLGPGDLLSERVAAPPRPRAGFISGTLIAGRWQIDFSFATSSPKRHAHLHVAAEFLRAAEVVADAHLTRALVENAFHAVEHLARAELLSYAPTIPLVENAKTHGKLSSTYNLWARLENTEGRFAKLLNDLSAARPSATYATGAAATPELDVDLILRTLNEMHDHVTRIVDGDIRSPIKVVATRDISAGAIVGEDDYTLRAPKPPRTA